MGVPTRRDLRRFRGMRRSLEERKSREINLTYREHVLPFRSFSVISSWNKNKIASPYWDANTTSGEWNTKGKKRSKGHYGVDELRKGKNSQRMKYGSRRCRRSYKGKIPSDKNISQRGAEIHGNRSESPKSGRDA